MKLEQQETRMWMHSAQRFLHIFKWLANSFVLDFYKDKHWDKLSDSWKKFLLQLTPEELGIWLDIRNTDRKYLQGKSLPPLSLMCFKASAQLMSLKRQCVQEGLDIKGSNNEKQCEQQSKKLCEEPQEFTNLFTRHIKLKKRHEIKNISKVICGLCEATDTEEVLDVGAGLGHLSRYLSFGRGLKLTCVDCVENYGTSATKFDRELSSFIAKQNSDFLDSRRPPMHKCLKLEMDKHDKYLQDLTTNFGIIGLHTCGNLAPVILHNFVNSPAKFFLSVGCCYMKMDSKGFPLSNFAKENKIQVGYEGMEVACHAIEQYCERLKNGLFLKLKIHSYRAVLETILVSRFEIHKAGLRSVPNSEKMRFPEYAQKAVESLGIELPDDYLENEHIQKMLDEWYNVVVFYSLRLLVANVIETMVLLDRSLFIFENVADANVHILPVFDPEISPRNLAIFGTR